jgi:predicted GNAT family N-acyltransferase
MSSKAWVIRRANWENDDNNLKIVRKEVFILEQSVPDALEWDTYDTNSLHLLAVTANNAPIGTARLRLINQSGQIGRMAVLKTWRRKGIGSALLKEMLRLAKQENLVSVFLHAQTQAIPFYTSFGFTATGAEFSEAGIPHQKMVRSIAHY